MKCCRMLHFEFKHKAFLPSNTIGQHFWVEKKIQRLTLRSDLVSLLYKIMLWNFNVKCENFDEK